MGQPGYDPSYGSAPQINNNLVIAIIGLLLFWPVGLFAVLSAAKVSGQLAQGDFAGATENAEKAKKLGKIAIGVGIGIYVLACCLVGVSIAVTASTAGSSSY